MPIVFWTPATARLERRSAAPATILTASAPVDAIAAASSAKSSGSPKSEWRDTMTRRRSGNRRVGEDAARTPRPRALRVVRRSDGGRVLAG
jgi:hypothetical protein